MVVKCGRREFECNENDRILDNGSRYILMTKSYKSYGKRIFPIVSKSTFNDLLHDGYIKLSKERYYAGVISGIETFYSLYEFKKQPINRAYTDRSGLDFGDMPVFTLDYGA